MKKRLLAFALILTLALGLCPVGLSDYENMIPSDGCVEYIKKHEGFMSRPYSDGTGWYIGYGCACNPADYPEPITEEEAEDLLWEKMDIFAESVNNFLKKYDISATQGQFDALCSMTYNFGPAWLKVTNRLPGYLADGVENYTEQDIVSAFAAWCHIGTTVNVNLLNRRIMEAKMFLYEDYSFSTDGWCWLIVDAGKGEAESDVFCYEEGRRYDELPTAEREGYVLEGWETEEGDILSERDRVKENLRVSAVWVREEQANKEEAGESKGEPTETPAQKEPTATVPGNVKKPGHVDVGDLFPDVVSGDWYYDYVRELTDREVIKGFEDGTFRPNNNVSWGQALKLVLLAAGYDVSDGGSGHWAQNYLNYAVEKGFVNKKDVPGLDADASRNDIADLAAAALQLEFTYGNSPYTDSDRYSVLALTKIGVVEGSVEEDGLRYFKGLESVSRSEISAIVWRIADYVDNNLIVFRGLRLPIRPEWEQNPYDPQAFRFADGRLYYDGAGWDIRQGIDVSYYQKSINWPAVAGDGIDYAIIRAGYRGCSAGELFADERYYENINGATAAGLDVGVYFFSQALTVEEAEEEARYLLTLLEGYDISYPVAYDWEPLNYSYSRTRSPNYSSGFLTDCAKAFCRVIREAGYDTMIYMNPVYAYQYFDLGQLQDETIWLAYYQPENDFQYNYHMWQYGTSGKVAGINGWVDMNISFYDYAQ